MTSSLDHCRAEEDVYGAKLHEIKKPEFKSFDCCISLIYIGVTSKSRTGAFFMSYLCSAKRENEPPEALLNHAEAEQRPRRGRECGDGRKDLSALNQMSEGRSKM